MGGEAYSELQCLESEDGRKKKHGQVVVSKIFYFHPYLGKIPILTNIFQLGWNHQLDGCVSNFATTWGNVLRT